MCKLAQINEVIQAGSESRLLCNWWQFLYSLAWPLIVQPKVLLLKYIGLNIFLKLTVINTLKLCRQQSETRFLPLDKAKKELNRDGWGLSAELSEWVQLFLHQIWGFSLVRQFKPFSCDYILTVLNNIMSKSTRLFKTSSWRNFFKVGFQRENGT